MKRLLVVLLLVATAAVAAQSTGTTRAAAPVKYGSNPAAGHTFTHDGVRLYYEVYGTGEPLLLVHPNGGSISDVAAQIGYFRRRYKVIAMDSRDQGKSADSSGKLTYEKMTDDLAALLDTLKAGPVNVVGWSDGGIEALLLGIRHPASVRKIVSMSANLNPTDKAFSPEVLGLIKSMVADAQSREATPQGRRELKTSAMMLEEPNVDLRELGKIQAPTLILSADHDLILLSHTIDIYNHIPNSQLAIFPNALHTIPFDDPATFNGAV
jgi:pimeloyl-ACP methyl ester carboxylesterase